MKKIFRQIPAEEKATRSCPRAAVGGASARGPRRSRRVQAGSRAPGAGSRLPSGPCTSARAPHRGREAIAAAAASQRHSPPPRCRAPRTGPPPAALPGPRPSSPRSRLRSSRLPERVRPEELPSPRHAPGPAARGRAPLPPACPLPPDPSPARVSAGRRRPRPGRSSGGDARPAFRRCGAALTRPHPEARGWGRSCTWPVPWLRRFGILGLSGALPRPPAPVCRVTPAAFCSPRARPPHTLAPAVSAVCGPQRPEGSKRGNAMKKNAGRAWPLKFGCAVEKATICGSVYQMSAPRAYLPVSLNSGFFLRSKNKQRAGIWSRLGLSVVALGRTGLLKRVVRDRVSLYRLQ
ncbi:basic proline-rich protein-like [Nycticebus coucang]|uniref:basic proline-rich protein-like n=1 Tax=Nycticebus coucang TaxID=9470 RepID=UPI00234E2536|nr:basic proline-rich protein-like [Nycticebus coucang]